MRIKLTAAQSAFVQLPAAAHAVLLGSAGTGKTAAAGARVAELVAAGAPPPLALCTSQKTAALIADAAGESAAASCIWCLCCASFELQMARPPADAE